MSETSRHDRSVLLTYSALALMAIGFVIMVGPDKINAIAKRDRH